VRTHFIPVSTLPARMDIFTAQVPPRVRNERWAISHALQHLFHGPLSTGQRNYILHADRLSRSEQNTMCL
jgi:hypothetical protein